MFNRINLWRRIPVGIRNPALPNNAHLKVISHGRVAAVTALTASVSLMAFTQSYPSNESRFAHCAALSRKESLAALHASRSNFIQALKQFEMKLSQVRKDQLTALHHERDESTAKCKQNYDVLRGMLTAKGIGQDSDIWKHLKQMESTEHAQILRSFKRVESSYVKDLDAIARVIDDVRKDCEVTLVNAERSVDTALVAVRQVLHKLEEYEMQLDDKLRNQVNGEEALVSFMGSEASQ